MKRVISLFLSIVMLFSIVGAIDLSAYATANLISGDYRYSTLTSTTAEFNHYYGNEKSISIPSIIDGYTIVSIGENAFNHSSVENVTIPNTVTTIKSYAFDESDLEKITIPDSVTTIGRNAFAQTNLVEVFIPDSVTSIGDAVFLDCYNLSNVRLPSNRKNITQSMFFNCTSLKKIDLPKSVTNIKDDAFENTSLENITFSENLIEIGAFAFSGCNNLKSITIPGSVTSIGSASFNRCLNLASVELSSGLSDIGSSAFKDCSKLSKVSLPDSLKTIGNQAFSNCSSLSSIILPSGLTDIGESAFYNTELYSVKLPENLLNIGSSAFQNTNLSNVVIPKNVTSIGSHPFYNCLSLTDIVVDSENKYYSSRDGALFNKDKSELIEYPTANSRDIYIVPNTVKYIKERAFNNCDKLMEITIPDSVTHIYYYAFEECSLQTLHMGSGIEFVDYGAFYHSGVREVIYNGTEDMWNQIDIDYYNDSLIYAYIHFNEGDNDAVDLVTQHLILADLAYKIKDGDQGVKKSVSDYKDKNAIYNGSSVKKADLFNSGLVKDFKVIQVKDNSATGFNGAVLVNNTTKQIVFTFRGTTEFEDFLSDKSFAIDNKLDGQFDDALKLYNDFVKNNKPYIDAGYTITFTGHSLGGALAADMAVKTGYQCYSFNGACGHTVHLSYFANWINASKSFTGVSGMPITNYAVSPSEKSGNTATDLASNLIQNTNYDLIYTTNYALNNNLKDPNVCYKHDLYAMTSPTSSKSIEMNKSISQNSPKSNWKKDIDFKNLGLTVGAFLGVSLPMMPITSSAVLCGTGYFIGSMCNTGSVHLGETSNDVIKTSSLNPLKQYTRVIYGGDGDDQLFGSFGNANLGFFN